MLNVIEKKCYQKDGNSVCVIKFNIDDIDKIYRYIGAKAFRNAYMRFYRKYKKLANEFHNAYMFTTFTVVGKAKCSPDDKFDAEKGMELAMQRAYQKVNVYNLDFISMLSNELEQSVMKKLYDKRNCTNNQICENTAKIKELSK